MHKHHINTQDHSLLGLESVMQSEFEQWLN